MDTTPGMASPVSDVSSARPTVVRVTFAGCGDAFGSGARFQACIHLDHASLDVPVLLDCGATSLTALRQCGLDPGEIGAVFVSHLHGDHFGGLPFLILGSRLRSSNWSPGIRPPWRASGPTRWRRAIPAAPRLLSCA
jgi:ribonuclease BN (tRNA processing enzyme)